MSERTLIPIFFFWAFLTIITPTLILLSENSKADLDSNGNITEGMKVSRMIGYAQNYITRTEEPQPSKSEEELASAPAPEPLPTPSSGTSTRVTPNGSHSHHNHTIISNRTRDGPTLSSPKILVQVNYTNIR